MTPPREMLGSFLNFLNYLTNPLSSLADLSPTPKTNKQKKSREQDLLRPLLSFLCSTWIYKYSSLPPSFLLLSYYFKILSYQWPSVVLHLQPASLFILASSFKYTQCFYSRTKYNKIRPSQLVHCCLHSHLLHSSSTGYIYNIPTVLLTSKSLVVSILPHITATIIIFLNLFFTL